MKVIEQISEERGKVGDDAVAMVDDGMQRLRQGRDVMIRGEHNRPEPRNPTQTNPLSNRLNRTVQNR